MSLEDQVQSNTDEIATIKEGLNDIKLLLLKIQWIATGIGIYFVLETLGLTKGITTALKLLGT